MDDICRVLWSLQSSIQLVFCNYTWMYSLQETLHCSQLCKINVTKSRWHSQRPNYDFDRGNAYFAYISNTAKSHNRSNKIIEVTFADCMSLRFAASLIDFCTVFSSRCMSGKNHHHCSKVQTNIRNNTPAFPLWNVKSFYGSSSNIKFLQLNQSI